MRTRRSRVRISIALLAVFAVVALFVVRLVDIQIVRADELNAQSEGKRDLTMVTYAQRGEIVDANGAVLADSVDRFDITASPKLALSRVDGLTLTVAEVDQLAALTKRDAGAILDGLTADPESDFAYIAQGVDLATLEAVRDLDLPWIFAEPRPERSYPNGAIAGNLVGYIGTDGPQAGLEISEDECLASTDGEASYERSADGVLLPGSEVVTTPPQPGGTLHLTIDRDLQYSVQQLMIQAAQRLGATWATAVVMRVSDGALLAVADVPSIDPNNVDGVPLDGEGHPAWGSRAFSTPFEPGSIMKPLTAASLLDAGVATPGSQVVAPYSLELPDGGGEINDALWHPPLNLTLAGSIVESSNTATAQFAQLLSRDARHQYMVDFGLGDYTEVDFIGESPGVVPEVSDWDARTTSTIQFGQGLSATSIQLASIYQTLGNGGVRMPVTLVAGCEHADGTWTDRPSGEGTRVVSEWAADQTINMMEMVAEHSSSAPNLTIPGYRIAVKSGTAEVAENGVYGDKAVLSYAGLAPAEDPEYVVLVSAGIPRMQLSGIIATTFRDVMSQVLTTYRVPPSTTPSNQLPLAW